MGLAQQVLNCTRFTSLLVNKSCCRRFGSSQVSLSFKQLQNTLLFSILGWERSSAVKHNDLVFFKLGIRECWTECNQRLGEVMPRCFMSQHKMASRHTHSKRIEGLDKNVWQVIEPWILLCICLTASSCDSGCTMCLIQGGLYFSGSWSVCCKPGPRPPWPPPTFLCEGGSSAGSLGG